MAEAVYKHESGCLRYTAGGAYAPGEVVPFSKFLAIYDGLDTATSGEEVTLKTRGVYEITCLSSDDIAVGALLYWDDGNSRLTTTASTHLLAGKAMKASGVGVATVWCDINAPGLIS